MSQTIASPLHLRGGRGVIIDWRLVMGYLVIVCPPQAGNLVIGI